MRLTDIEPSMRLDDFLCVGERPIHGDMEVIVARIFMKGVNCLVFGKTHSPKKETDHLIQLFMGRRSFSCHDRIQCMTGILL